MQKRIGEILLEAGNIKSEDINKVLDIQKTEGMKRRFGEILMDEEGIAEGDIFRALSTQFNMPLIDMEDFPETLPIEKISFDFLEKKRETLLSLNPDDITHIIRRSCEIKADIVSRDERESGIRAILNFGHTIGHAIETVTGYTTFLHGEAIAIGMHAEAILAREAGLIGSDEVSRIRHLIKTFGLPTEIPADIDLTALFGAMKLDKKAVSGDVKFILPEQIGRVRIQGNILEKVVQQAIKKALSA